MKFIADDLWFCSDCLMWAVNGDLTGVDNLPEKEAAKRYKEVTEGQAELAETYGGSIVPDFDSETGEGIREFSNCGCDGCGSPLAGEFHRFAILGEES